MLLSAFLLVGGAHAADSELAVDGEVLVVEEGQAHRGHHEAQGVWCGACQIVGH